MRGSFAWLSAAAPDSVALLFLDTVVKATVLLVVAWLVAVVLRRASAAVRHRVWCLAFSGLLLLPVLSSLLPGWRVPILPQWAEADAAPAGVGVSVETTDSAIGTPPFPMEFPESDAATMRLERRFWNEPPADFDPSVLAAQSLTTPLGVFDRQDEATAPPPALPVPSDRPNSRAFLLMLAGVFWLLGMSATVLPVVVSVIHNHIVGNGAHPVVDAERTRLLSELCHSLGVRRAVRLLETGTALVPMTWGVLRPIVLLPFTWRDWAPQRRRFVLLHELAHVKRCDVAFQLLARLTCALYWFHPLAWYALRRLRIERELACDDCVLMSGGRPADYAQQLVEIARSSRMLALPAAVAMAQSTKLEHRVRAVLDRARSHLPLGRTAARVLLLCAVVVVTGMAVIRPAAKSQAKEETPTDVAKTTVSEQSANEPKPQDVSDDGEIAISGRVLDPDGKPLGAARVLAIRTLVAEASWAATHEVLGGVNSASDGRFSVKYAGTSDRFSNGASFVQEETYLVAQADGFGPDWAFVRAGGTEDDVTLQLASDTVPIEGRVLNLEGRPVEGVRVRVERVVAAETPLDEWIVKARKNPTTKAPRTLVAAGGERPKVAYFPGGKRLRTELLPIFPEVVTDAHGHFRFKGLGNDREIKLRLDGRRVATTWLLAVTRPMEPIPMPVSDPRFRNNTTFGARFDFTTEPAQPIVGVARDADTGEPLVGVHVGLMQYAESLLDVGGFLSAVTDADGRFALEGVPKPTDRDRSHRLCVLSGPNHPYFRTDVSVPKREGLAPVTCDIELKRGIWLTGRVTDQQTAEPVRALVSYYPFLSNPHAQHYQNFVAGRTSLGHDDHYATADDGTFRLPAIRGRGIVSVVARDPACYRVGEGVDAIDGLQRDRGRLNVYHLGSANMANSIRQVNAAEGQESINGDVAVVPLKTARVRVVDETGNPLAGVRIGGRLPRMGRCIGGASWSFWGDSLDTAQTVEFVGLDEELARPLMFYHVKRKLGAIRPFDWLASDVSEARTVQLLPCAEITGRLVDETGQPLTEGYVSAGVGKIVEVHSYGQPTRKSIEHSLAWIARLDDDGRFRHFILPNATYTMLIKGMSKRSNTVIASDLTVGVGERIDLGEIDVTADADSRPVLKRISQTSQRSPKHQATLRSATAQKISVRGVVLSPDGKPMPGAIVRATTPVWAMLKPILGKDAKGPIVETRTDQAGRFTVSFTTQPFGDLSHLDPRWRDIWKKTEIVASSQGFGPAWVEYEDIKPNEPITLRLVPDLPIKGRVIDLEGRPIAGLTVKVGGPAAAEDEDLTPWLNAAKAGELPWTLWKLTPKSIDPEPAGIPQQVTTDEQGRFEIHGVGSERYLALVFEGETVAHRGVGVTTRQMKPIDRVISKPPSGGPSRSTEQRSRTRPRPRVLLSALCAMPRPANRSPA